MKGMMSKGSAALAALIAAAQAPAANTLDPALADTLRADWVAALEGEQCAFAFPYLTPLYMPTNPTSEDLKRSRRHAEAAGLGGVIADGDREFQSLGNKLRDCTEAELAICKPEPSPEKEIWIRNGAGRPPYNCQTQAFARFERAKGKFEKSLDAALATLSVYNGLPPGASPRIVKDRVLARWGLENANEYTCADKPEMALWTQEKARAEAVRGRLHAAGRDAELAAADNQFAIEEVREARRPGDRSYMVCTLEDTHDGHDEIELLLLDFGNVAVPTQPAKLDEDVRSAVRNAQCLQNRYDFRADDRFIVQERRLAILGRLFDRWGWKPQLAMLAEAGTLRDFDDCEELEKEVLALDGTLDRLTAALAGIDPITPARIAKADPDPKE